MIENLSLNLLHDVARESNDILSTGNIGIEKENLRVLNNTIAQTPHNKNLGSSLCNRYITTDFSESLLEMVTPTFTTNDSLFVFLEDIHEFVYKNINNESLWPFSIPPIINNESEILSY